MSEPISNSDLTELTVSLVGAFVANNSIRADDLPAFIAATHASLTGLTAAPAAAPAPAAATEHVPAVTARKSLASQDHILSMIDGKPYRTLRRHLSTNGLTPDEYRARYKLPASYPMVAPSYSASRSEMAKKIGLGRKAKAAEPEAVPAPVTAKVRGIAAAKAHLSGGAKPKATRKPRAKKADAVEG